MAEIKELQTQIDNLNLEHQKLWTQIEQIVDQKKKLQDQLDPLLAKELFPTPESITPEKIMSLNWYSATGEIYRQVTKYMDSFKYIRGEGSNIETNQMVINTRFYKNEPLEPQIAEILQFVPYIKPFKHREFDFLVKFINISEYTLSKYASISMHFTDNKFFITEMRYYSFNIVKTFDKIEDCLGFIKEKFYYEKGKK